MRERHHRRNQSGAFYTLSSEQGSMLKLMDSWLWSLQPTHWVTHSFQTSIHSQLTSKSTNVLILKSGNYSIHISSTQGDQCPLCGITDTEATHCTVCRLRVSDYVLIYYRRWEMKGKADIKCVIKSSTWEVDTVCNCSLFHDSICLSFVTHLYVLYIPTVNMQRAKRWVTCPCEHP